MEYEPNSVDGFWAYTSHTVIPKAEFETLLKKYSRALKAETGILALGMIEGDFEGWKSDGKYDGNKRFVARYSRDELENLCRKYFGSVSITRETVEGKVYLHCLCKNTAVADMKATSEAAQEIFNAFSSEYLDNTQGGIKLLEADRKKFVELLGGKTSGKKIIDIGCGPGRDLKIFAAMGLDALGFDISEANIKNCRKFGLNAVRGDIYFLENYFPNDIFDAAWCNCSVTNWILKDKLLEVLLKIKNIITS